MIAELDRVTLARPVTVEATPRLLPPGTQGTVVAVYPAGVAFEVEFALPDPVVVTVWDLEIADVAAKGGE